MKINKGFTLIELLVVIAIVGILSGFVVVSMSSAINAAKDAKIKSDIGTLSKALLVYAANNSTYPGGTGTTSDTYPCTIGGGTTRCTNLEANLAPYLTAIPKTPNNGFYTYSYSGTGPSFTLQSTLTTGSTYQYNSSSYFSTISYTSTCETATNTEVQCVKTDISPTEEVCRCIYLSGAGTTSWTVPTGVTQVRYLIVGGGGGGAFAYGGGGGAGGFRTTVNFSVSSPVSITVGKGGVADGGNGENSIFGSITALGGGGGGINAVGNNGASGGGGSGNGGFGGGTGSQGYNGGSGNAGSLALAGGGGGSGGAGGSYSGSTGGAGGIGTYSNITGPSVVYAAGGGGGGGNYGGYTGGTGGSGIGGNATYHVTGSSGATQTGSGGGGGASSPGGAPYWSGGAGGSGVVIFRYTHP
jgi:type II secretion system protein G